MAPAHETRAKLAVFLPPLCFVGFILVTSGASRARRGYFGSPLKTGGEVHVHSTKAADGLLVARSSVGNSEGRPETASIESFQSVMLAVLERLGGWAQPDPSIYAAAGRLRHKSIAVDATPSPRLRPLVGVSFYAINASGREMRHPANYGKSTTPHTKPRLVEMA